MRRVFSHKRVRIASAFLGTLGVATVALAVWSGLLQMPFQGGAGEAPGSVEVNYGAGVPYIDARNLLPLEGVPAMGVGDWNWAFPKVNNIGFWTSSQEPLRATMKLVVEGTPHPDLLDAIHYRLGWGSALPGLPNANAFTTTTNVFVKEGTLTDLIATGYTFPANVGPATQANMRIVFWLDPDAPVTIAGDTFTGTLDVSTTVAP